MKLSPSRPYMITKNFVPVPSDDGAPLMLYKPRIAKLTEYSKQLEVRTGVIVIDPQYDEFSYLNYIYLLSELAKPLISQGKDNKFTELLDSGYLPLYLLPSTFKGHEVEIFYNAIINSGLDYIRTPAYKVTGERIDAMPEDIWVSRLDLALKYGVPPEQQRAAEMLMQLISL